MRSLVEEESGYRGFENLHGKEYNLKFKALFFKEPIQRVDEWMARNISGRVLDELLLMKGEK